MYFEASFVRSAIVTYYMAQVTVGVVATFGGHYVW